MYFWDRILLRLHFGFTVVPGGAAWVLQALTGAYIPHSARLFTVLPTSRGLYPQPLDPRSLWVLTQDCPPGTLLNRHANHALQDFLRGPAGMGIDPAILAANVAAAGPSDLASFLALTSQNPPPSPAVEAAAMIAVLNDHVNRMIDFRVRVRMAAPVAVNPRASNPVLAEFTHFWRVYLACGHPPASFTIGWFSLEVKQALMRWPGLSPSAMSTQPTWLDASEWQFLLCAYQILQPTDRLALLLLLYAGLNIRQINRLLYNFQSQSGWQWSDSRADWGNALDHLVDVWMTVIRCLGRAAGVPRRIGT